MKDIKFGVRYGNGSKRLKTSIRIHEKYIECPLTPDIKFKELSHILINHAGKRCFGLRCKGIVFTFFAKKNGKRHDILSEILNRFPSNDINRRHRESIQSATGEEALEIDHNVEHSEGEQSELLHDDMLMTTVNSVKVETNPRICNDETSCDDSSVRMLCESVRRRKEALRMRQIQNEMDREKDRCSKMLEDIRREKEELNRQRDALDVQRSTMESERKSLLELQITAKEMEDKYQKLKEEVQWERKVMEDERRKTARMESVRRQSIKLNTKRMRDELKSEREKFREHAQVQMEKLKVKEAELKGIRADWDRQKKNDEIEIQNKREELQREILGLHRHREAIERKERIVQLERDRLNLNSRRKKLKKVSKETMMKEADINGAEGMIDESMNTPGNSSM